MGFRPNLNESEARLEWTLIVSVGLLLLLGMSFIYSATMVSESAQTLPLYKQAHFKQLIWSVAGLSIATMICLVDYRSLSRWALVAYWGAIILLVLVLIIGVVRGGARRWISMGPFQFQPSELAKLAFIFAFAHFLSRPKDELRMRSIFVKSLGMILLPVALVLVEPDLGSALLFLPVGLVMMYVAGIPGMTLAKLVGGTIVLVIMMVSYVLFVPTENQRISIQEYQRRRLLVFFDMDYAPQNASDEVRRAAERAKRHDSYNVRQALISVGSGGLTGKGFQQGTQNALGYLPRGVAHNDFIFSVIAEEKGFVGSIVVIGLYAAFLFSGLRIASQARDRLGKILAAGVVTLFFSQIFINIGMNIRLMPVTGVPLPLLSYGGSSALSSLIAAGILQNVYIYRKVY